MGERVSDEGLLTAVRAIWERSRDAIMHRVTVFEQAVAAATTGELAADVRRDAEREVHKLAGAVGTFGFWDASTLAKEAEVMLQGDTPITPADALRLSTIAGELRAQLSVVEPGQKPTPPPPEEPVSTFVKRRHPKLLLIGHDAEFRDRMIAEARTLGVDVLAAHNGAEARTLLADSIDAVILDLTIPEVGFAFLEEIHVAFPALPVIVISDADEFQDRVEAARLGGRGFLQKPVRPSQLIDLLRDSLVAAPHEVATIVAVDDDPELLALIQALLQPIGARVLTVSDPLRVLHVLVEHAPDLVMLDVDMPGLNGIELCRVLRNDPRWAALPVLFLTAQSEPNTVMQMFEAGADDFVAKPVLGPELVARVRNRLERTRMLRLAGDVDSLTGVATRRRGIEVLERIFRLAQRQRQLISVAAIDLDHFKQVNDRFGHLVGDMVLRRVATILSTCFRGEDVVARWGGEEFIVAIYSMPSGAAARRLNQALERLRAEIFEAAGEEPLTVTFSAGVAEFPSDGADWTTVYRVADDALSRAKTDGRNRVVCVPRDTAEVETQVDVVIVDEDPELVRQIEEGLHLRGCRTMWMRDGAAAIQLLGGQTPKVRARVIVLDVSMPGNDGYTVLRALSNDAITERSRVIMMTNGTLEADALHALELVAFAHLTKPFSVIALLELVRTAMETRHAKP
jgi:diguanylate cyclase (GGDEF)-like protein